MKHFLYGLAAIFIFAFSLESLAGDSVCRAKDSSGNYHFGETRQDACPGTVVGGTACHFDDGHQTHMSCSSCPNSRPYFGACTPNGSTNCGGDYSLWGYAVCYYDEPPTCEAPSTLHPRSGECGHWCEAGEQPSVDVWRADDGILTIGIYDVYTCPQNDIDEDEASGVCQGSNLEGYYKNTPICSDNRNLCEAVGGKVGITESFTQKCLPLQGAAPADDQLPRCNYGEVAVYNITDGVMQCENLNDSPEDVPEPQQQDIDDDGIDDAYDDDIDGDTIPDHLDPDVDGDGINNGEDDDIDGDRIPNHSDSDMDGDGLDNGSDPDTDGDGILNGSDPDDDADGIPDTDDPTQTGPEEGEDGDSTVDGGGSCEAEPSCDGDAVSCSINYQIWRNRCDQKYDEDYVDELVNDGPKVGELYADEQTDLTDTLSGIYSQNGASGSCPGIHSLNFSIGSADFDWQPICDVATGLRPLILIGFSFFAFLTVVRSFD